MAIIYCDYAAGLDANNGSTWALAKLTLQAAVTAAGAGGTVYVRTDATPTKDTAAANRTLVSPGTILNPVSIIGVKTATTAEPPTNADIAIRGTDNLPMFEATGSGNDVSIGTGFTVGVGIAFKAADRFILASSPNHVLLRGSEITFPGRFFLASGGQTFLGIDNDYKVSAGSRFLSDDGAKIILEGGLLSGTAPDFLFDEAPSGDMKWTGGDLTLLSGQVGMDLSGAKTSKFILRNCSLPASFTLAGGSANDHFSYAELISSSDDSGLGSTDSVRAYERHDIHGTCVLELTAIRTGGANDGASGGFSYALTPNVNAPTPPYFGVQSPMRKIWESGDGAERIIEIFFTHSTGGADSVEGEVVAKFFTPSSSGSAQHDRNDDDDFVEIIPAIPAALTDDTGSSWGAGTENDQKLTLTLSASDVSDFQGPLFYQLQFNQRSGTPDTLYHDPRPVVT